MDKFADIRPFNDNEAADAITAILADDGFIAAIRRLRWGALPDCINFLSLPVIRRILKRQLKGVRSPDKFQQRMFSYMDYMIATTINELSVSGIEKLSADMNYLFISNHRDITLDAALAGRVLFERLQKTPRNAIGDNLLQPDFVSTLFRLNKCFIVNRRTTSPRKQLANMHRISTYINFCLKEDNHCVWLSQKEGRAKNGLDKTHPAIIKMLAMAKSPYEMFSDFITSLHIVPISISYEYDPCDLQKANELYMLATTGRYTKTEREDFTSMGMGILGYKGNVHLSIGKVIHEDLPDANAVAHFLDREIIDGYKLHNSNLFAYRLLYGEIPVSKHNLLAASPAGKDMHFFDKRLKSVPEHLRKYWLTMYANPVISKLQSKNH